MKKHVRAVLDDLNRTSSSASRGIPPQNGRPAGPGGRGQVAGASRDELVGQHGEGDRFLRVGIDSVVGGSDHGGGVAGGG